MSTNNDSLFGSLDDAYSPNPFPAPKPKPKVTTPPAGPIPPASSQTLREVLAARGHRYGPYKDHATVTRRLKDVIYTELGQRGKTLEPHMLETLDMICHKIGRIINGDPFYDDNWVDIAGYAQRTADIVRGED